MTTVSDITTTIYSGLNTIDALLDDGPDWNYMTPAGNTITYTFSVASGNEDGKTGQVAFTAAQQAAARGAIAYVAKLTGIQFVESSVGTAAQLHLANIDIDGPNVTGLCSWTTPYSYNPDTGVISSFNPQAWVYLDNAEWAAENSDLTPGGNGYETLLHELGHALGLKHPFDNSTNGNTNHLPDAQDNTSNTLMSYTHVGGPYSTYSQDDIAALNWLYGGDGLRGALGMNSTAGGRYFTGTRDADVLTGTAANDALEGDGGNDTLDGGAGTDTAVFREARSNYTFTALAGGALKVTSLDGTDGVDTLTSIELLKFSDVTVNAASLVDTTPPAAPTLSIATNANGYVLVSSPVVSGTAEANATVNLYAADHTLLATTTASATGAWTAKLGPLSDALHYQVTATATDAAGNTSPASNAITFNLDAHAPVAPTATVPRPGSGNAATISGSGEVGTTIHLVNGTGANQVELGSTTVGATGKWSVLLWPLPNATYDIGVTSTDAAGYSTSAANRLGFSVSSTANVNGSAGNDVITASNGSHVVIDGKDGLDTVVFAGTRASYTVAKEALGLGVVGNAANSGHDVLQNVERIEFADSALAFDIEGAAGKLFRTYQAVFDRAPDLGGFGYWLHEMDRGVTQLGVMASFIQSPEYVARYGTGQSSADYITSLYSNVFHRAPDAGGFKYWVDDLDVSHVPRDAVLASFIESPEFKAQIIGSIENGMAYIPYHP